MLRPVLLVGALCAVLTIVPPAAADGVLKPQVLRAPGSVSGGDTSSITFDAGLATRCSVTFQGPRRAKAGPFTQVLRGGILRASFRVNRAAARGTWRGRIACSTDKTIRTTSLKLRVKGTRAKARGSLVVRKSFRFGVGRSDTGGPIQTLTPQKNDPVPDAPQLGAGPYDNARIADIALSRIKQRAGECKPAVNAWVLEASGGKQRLGTDYHSNYAAQGGVKVDRDQAVKGDIIQLHNPADQRGYYWPMHTAVVVSHQAGSNVFDVVDSNYVVENTVGRHQYDPYREAAGRLQVTIWRMGTVTTPPPPPKLEEPLVAPNGYQVVYGLAGNGALSHLWYKPTIAGTLGSGPLGTVPGTVDVAAAPTVDGHQVVYNLGTDGSVNELYFKPGVANTLGQGRLGAIPGATRIAATRAPDGYQVVYGLAPTGAVTHLYYKPTVAGTLGVVPLATTPGTVDIATMPTTDGYQVVYTLAADGTVYEIYYKPGVAGTLGQGKLGTMPGVTRIAAGRTADGYQVVYGLAPNGTVSQLFYKPRVAGTLGVGTLAATPGTVDITAASTNDGYQVVYTLGADSVVNELYFKPGVAGTLGQGRLGGLPGVTQIAAAND